MMPIVTGRKNLVVSPNILVASPSFKNLYDTFFTKWPEMSKLSLHLENDLYSLEDVYRSIPHEI